VNPNPNPNSKPNIGLAGPFVAGVGQGVVRYQSCLDCGVAQSLARYACQNCRSPHLQWCDAIGTGTVYALTVVARAPSDSFRALVPYTLVLVTLDEGFRLMAHGHAPLKIGDRVVARTFVHDDKALVIFHAL
jgi:uncharacterized protein